MREQGLTGSTGSTSIDQQENVMCIEMFYLNTIEQLFLFVEQLDQLEVWNNWNTNSGGIPKFKVEFK